MRSETDDVAKGALTFSAFSAFISTDLGNVPW
jgi:hypothetical protein